jgi:small-conductance mechanosensitive channel
MSHSENSSLNPTLPSERSFGLLFFVVFLIAAAYFWHKDFSDSWIQASIVLSLAFLLAGLFAPVLLRPLNKLWFQLGLLMGRVVSPIVLGVLFFILISPIAILMRVFGRDELKLKKRDVASYWVERQPHGPAPESFKDQF